MAPIYSKLQIEIEDINGLLSRGGTWGGCISSCFSEKRCYWVSWLTRNYAAEAHAQLERKALENVDGIFPRSEQRQNSSASAREAVRAIRRGGEKV